MKIVGAMLFLFVSIMAMAVPQNAIPADDSLASSQAASADSDTLNFVRTSIIISSQDVPIYSALGHCAIRMQCPSADLDYCFSLELEPGLGDYVKYFQGRTLAGIYAEPTREFIEMMRKDGRGIEQYELNLTLPEKRLLWKQLDEDMMRGQVHEFNLINTNCVQVSLTAIERALTTDSIEYNVPSLLRMKSGEILRSACRYSPWTEFLFTSIAGAIMDRHVPIANCLSPETIVLLLGQSRFVDIQSGKSRTVFRHKPTTLLKKTKEPVALWLTPSACFLILFVAVTVITLGEKKYGWHRIAMITDIMMLVFQTLAGMLLVYMAVSSNLFGSRWNWYLIPFNPIPALAWLLCRKRSWYAKTYLAYTAILILFVCATPLSVQLDIPHALLCATMAVRTAAHIKNPRCLLPAIRTGK